MKIQFLVDFKDVKYLQLNFGMFKPKPTRPVVKAKNDKAGSFYDGN